MTPFVETVRGLTRLPLLPALVPSRNIRECQPAVRNTFPPPVSRVFSPKIPEAKGDNCLLTRASAFVDLAFSCLLA
jgi:hypothetical protein